MRTREMDLAHKKYTVFIGLEDSKRSWKLSIIESTGKRKTSMESDFTKLKNTLNASYCKMKDQVYIVYESGPGGFVLCHKLRAEGYHCDVIPAHRVPQDKVTKIKTDRRDAYILAELAKSGPKSICEVPDREREEDREISRTLERVKRDITAVKNRIRGKLYCLGLPFPFPAGKTWTKAHLKYLKEFSCASSLKTWLTTETELLELLMKQRLALSRELKKISKSERYTNKVDVLVSFPGVGWYTAIRILLEIGDDWSRFENEKQVASFVGLVCSEFSTGETTRRGHITGLGSRAVRGWIIQCSWASTRQDGHLRDKFNRVVQNSGGSKKKAIVAVARVMVVRMRACLLKNEKYRIIPIAKVA